jgi:hypothetical protein
MDVTTALKLTDPKQLDKFETLAIAAKVGAIVLCDASMEHFELIELGAPVTLKAKSALGGGDLGFMGVVGVLPNGEFRSALVTVLPDSAITTLAAAWTAHLVHALAKRPAPRGDSAKWLHDLLRLEDSRPVN